MLSIQYEGTLKTSYKVLKVVKFRKYTESKIVVAKGWGSGELFNEGHCGFQFWAIINKESMSNCV